MMYSKLSNEDARLMLAAHVHLGTNQVNYQMQGYIHGKIKTGGSVIRIDKTWEKLVLAARAICAVENSQDVAVVGTQKSATRAVLKFAKYTNSFAIAGRFTPGTFTNQIQKAFREPRLLVISSPSDDRQAINEAHYVNIPVVALCDSNSDLRYIDIVIPCNTRSPQSIGLIWWLLCREVLRMRGTISRDVPWDVMVDLFIFREQEEQEEDTGAGIANQMGVGMPGVLPIGGQYDDGGDMMIPAAPGMEGAIDDWGTQAGADWGVYGAVGEPTGVPPTAVAAPVPGPAPQGNFNEWSQEVGDDWGAM
jgi:small subunit ribosomal protein SAe